MGIICIENLCKHLNALFTLLLRLFLCFAVGVYVCVCVYVYMLIFKTFFWAKLVFFFIKVELQ